MRSGRWFVLCFALLLAAPATADAACTITFDNSSGDGSWNTAANWTTNVLPSTTDEVCLGNATVTHTAATATTVLGIDGAGVLQVSAGSLRATGPSDLRGTLHLLGGAAFVNDGTLALSGKVTANPGGTFDNRGTLELRGTASMDDTALGSGTVVNSGTLRSAAGATAQTRLPLRNTGTIDAAGGTLTIGPATGVDDTGGMAIGAGATLALNAPRNLTTILGTPTSALTVNGAVTTTGDVAAGTIGGAAGSLTVGGDLTTALFDSTGVVLVPSSDTTIAKIVLKSAGFGAAAISGASVVTTSDFAMSGGAYISGSGRLTIAPGGAGTITGGGQGRELRVEGTLRVTGGLNLGVGAPVDVRGILELRDDADLGNSGGSVRIRAGGTLVKPNGVGSSEVVVPVEDDGTLAVASGTLRTWNPVAGGGAHDGVFAADAGARLDLSGGNQDMSAAATIDVDGTLALTGGASGTIQATATIADLEVSTVNGVAFTGPTTVTGQVRQSGGSLAFDDPISAATLTQSGGELRGSADVSFGAATITGGSQSGGGRTTLTGAGTVVGSLGVNRPVTVAGDLDLLGGGTGLNVSTDGEVEVSGTLDLRADTDIGGSGASPVVRVLAGGALRKPDGAGQSRIFSGFENDGTVGVTTGTLTLDTNPFPAVTDAGSATIAAGAALELGGTRQVTGSITGAGTLRGAGPGTAQLDGTVNVGTIEGAGSTLVFSTPVTAGTVRANAGTLRFLAATGPGAVVMGGGTIDSAAAFAPGALSGTGTIAGGGLTLGAAVDVEVPTGTLTVAGMTSAGSVTARGTGTLALTGATVSSGGLEAREGGRITVGGALVRNDGTLTVRESGELAVASTLDNAGTVELRDDADVTGAGEVRNRGAFTKATAGGVSVVSPAYRDFASGTTTVTAGTLRLANMASISGGLLSGGTYDVTGTLDVPGRTITGVGAQLTLRGAGAITNGASSAMPALAQIDGAVRLRDGAALATTAPGLTVTGLLSVGGGSTATADVSLTGTLEGTGTVDGDVDSPSGIVAPGLAGVGTLTVTGDYEQADPAGELRAEVGTSGGARVSDRLAVGGTATLGGRLAITTLPGTTPVPGDEVTILTHATRSDTFESVTGAALGGVRSYKPQYGATQTTLAVTDTDVPSLTVSDATATEGQAAQVDLTLDLDPTAPLTVDVATSSLGAGATAGTDYTARPATPVTFGVGQRTVTVPVTTLPDSTDEAAETFSVVASNPSPGLAIADGTGTVTITDDDPAPTVGVEDFSGTEGDSGTRDLEAQIRVSQASERPINLLLSTAEGTASASDFAGLSAVPLTIPPGTTLVSKTIAVNGDTLDEANETFTLTVTSADAAATIADGTATGTILDDDTGGGGPGPVVPTVSVADTSTAEGDSGTTDASFVVSLSAPTSRTVAVDYATTPGTATDGADFAGRAGTLVFGEGQTTRTVRVPVNGDTVDEPDETYTVTLTAPANATPADATATGTITDDDSPASTPTLSIADVTPAIAETGTATFTVTLSAASAQSVGVDYTTASATATEGADFSARFGRLVFAPGSTTRTVAVPAVDDTLDEVDEAFDVLLSDPSGATLADASGRATITDDDAMPRLTLQAATLAESDADQDLSIPARLDAASGRDVSATVRLVAGTAGVPGDVGPLSRSVTIPAGTRDVDVPITVKGDLTAEAAETFTADVTSSSGIQSVSARQYTITDDDAAPTASITGTPAANEGEPLAFNLRLSSSPKAPVTVGVRVVDGAGASPAALGTDAPATAASATFATGQTEATVSIPTTEDDVYEYDERLALELADGSSRATGTIVDDDAPPNVSFVNERSALLDYWDGYQRNPLTQQETKVGEQFYRLAATLQVSGVAERPFDATVSYEAIDADTSLILGPATSGVTIPVGAESVPAEWAFDGSNPADGLTLTPCVAACVLRPSGKIPAARPSLPASAAVGQRVSCPVGTWRPALTGAETVTTTWIEDGTGKAIADGPTLIVPASAAGKQLACFNTIDGVHGGRSNLMTVAELELVVTLPVVQRATVAPGGQTSVPVTCPAGSRCSGTLTLRTGAVGKATIAATFAAKRFSIAAGKTAKVKVRLSTSARRKVRRAGRKGLKVTPVVSLTKPVKRTVVGKAFRLQARRG